MELSPVLENVGLNKLSLGELYLRVKNDKTLQSYDFWLLKTKNNLKLKKKDFDLELKNRSVMKDEFPYMQAFIELLENEVSTTELVEEDFIILSKEVSKNGKVYEYFKSLLLQYSGYTNLPPWVNRQLYMGDYIDEELRQFPRIIAEYIQKSHEQGEDKIIDRRSTDEPGEYFLIKRHIKNAVFSFPVFNPSHQEKTEKINVKPPYRVWLDTIEIMHEFLLRRASR